MKKPLKIHKKVPSAVLAYFPTKHKIEIDFWNMLRSLAKEYPEVVQKRLEWIIFYETLGKCDAIYTSKYFNISTKKNFINGTHVLICIICDKITTKV